MDALPDILGLPRHRRSVFTPAATTGIYALFLADGSKLADLVPADKGLIYIGKAEGASGFVGRCHFSGQTLNHSPRKSLAVLLRPQLNLKFKGHPPSKWGLETSSDETLSNWMRENLLVAYLASVSASLMEERLVRLYEPPLNLTICSQGPQQALIRQLRSAAKSEALKSIGVPTKLETRTPTLTTTYSARSDDSASSIASRYGLNPKSFRAALRRQNFNWHTHGTSWDVVRQSSDWRRMIQVAMAMSGRDLGELK